MNWPTPTDYRDALQHPERFFRIPRIEGYRAETNRLGVPRPRTGASAHVYKLVSGSAPLALRVFLYPGSHRREHYQALHQHLQRVQASSLVSFEYHAEGLHINRGRFPVLLMDWVEGPTLGEWLQERVARGDIFSIRKMAESWIALVSELRSCQVAHGDLQHDNILVVGEQPRLVDYDGMCVPALVGQEALESGKPGYQHPGRSRERLSLELDHFSAWSILLSLRAIADDPSLYQRHVVGTGNENLLFSEEDLRVPERSALWPQLLSSADPDVRTWAQNLRNCLGRPFTSIPPFEVDPMSDMPLVFDPDPIPQDTPVKSPLVLPTTMTLPEPLERVPTSLVLLVDPAGESIEKLEQALAHPGDGRGLLALWKEHQAALAGHPEAETLWDRIQEWQHRIDACERYLETLPRGRTHEIADAWQWLQGVGGHPDAEKERARGEQAVRWSERLQQLSEIDGTRPLEEQDRLWVSLWDENLLRGCPEAASLKPRYEPARRRVEKMARVEDAVRRGDPAVVQLVQDPDLRNYPPLLRLQPYINQAVLLQKLDAACRGANRDWSEILRLAEEAERAGLTLQPEVMSVIGEARDRRKVRQELEAALGTRSARVIAGAYRPQRLDDWKECEELVRKAREACALVPILDQFRSLGNRPEEGPRLLALWEQHRQRLGDDVEVREIEARVRRWQECCTAAEELRRAGQQGASDREVVRAWDRVQLAGGHPEAERWRERADLAKRRVACLDALIGLPRDLPRDELDRHWVQRWNEDLLAEVPEARELRPRYEEARARLSAWEALKSALDARALFHIAHLAAQTNLQDYPPYLADRDRIEQLAALGRRCRSVLERLERNDPLTFDAEEDRACLRDASEVFRSHLTRIAQPGKTWKIRQAQMTPGSPPLSVGPGRRVIAVRWAWRPLPGLSHCLLAIDGHRFFERPAETSRTVKVRWEDFRRASGCTMLPVPPGAAQVFVTIWPIFDLGWISLAGEPLRLGPIGL